MKRTLTLVEPMAEQPRVHRDGGAVSTNEGELLRVLHDQHARALWVYVLGLTHGDGAKAQDVVQETMLRAWRHPDVLEQSGGSARGWLFTVARRIVIDEWRAARVRPEVVTDAPPERQIEDRTAASADRQLLVAALRQLSPDHRAVLVECYLHGSTVAEAARTLGVPAGTVKSRTHYALQALRLAVEELGGLQ